MLIGVLNILTNTETLDTRDQAMQLFDSLHGYCPQCSEIIFDFAGIEFMSRSFADQFHKERMKFQEEKNVKVFIENENSQIHDILNAVCKTQKLKVRKQHSFEFHSFFSREQVFQFVSTL